jgi:hypothetical protein
MGVLYDDPIFRIHKPPLFGFERDHEPFAMYHVADICLISQKLQNSEA